MISLRFIFGGFGWIQKFVHFLDFSKIIEDTCLKCSIIKKKIFGIWRKISHLFLILLICSISFLSDFAPSIGFQAQQVPRLEEQTWNFFSCPFAEDTYVDPHLWDWPGVLSIRKTGVPSPSLPIIPSTSHKSLTIPTGLTKVWHNFIHCLMPSLEMSGVLYILIILAALDF